MKRKTAVITGASSGIGKEFAYAFAKKGYRLVLTGRRTERLEALAEELKVPCRIWSADLSDEEQCYDFMERLKKNEGRCLHQQRRLRRLRKLYGNGAVKGNLSDRCKCQSHAYFI